MERNDKPVTELMRDLVNQVSNLVRHEIQLARAEMGEKANQATNGVVMLAVALGLGIGAIVILLLAAVAILEGIMAFWLSALLVGLVAALAAAGLASMGLSNLKARNLMPDRTIESVREEAQYAKEKVK